MPSAAPLLLFDGHCVLCAWSTRFILSHERAPLIRFVAITSAEGRALAQMHGIDPDTPMTFLFIEDRAVFGESDAVLHIAAYLVEPWRALGAARIIPRALRDAAYRFTARHRYRIFGRTDACLAPDAATRARFTLPEAR